MQEMVDIWAESYKGDIVVWRYETRWKPDKL